ncbi:uncharacterized protein ACMZJ9_022214 [Mantella aurantiaca]
MRSHPALLPLCVLLAASYVHSTAVNRVSEALEYPAHTATCWPHRAVSRDLYAAAGDEMVIPLETRLNRTSGQFCNTYVWKYLESPQKYLMDIAGLDSNCKRTECVRPGCTLTGNGSLHLHHVTHRDTGLYTIITYHTNRAKNTHRDFQLHVLDVVSEPVVELQCVSNESLLVTCSVEDGTGPQILLTINGERFMESGMGRINVTKSFPPPWNISCSANNEVSHRETAVSSTACPDPLLDPFLDTSCHPDGSVEISCAVGAGSDPSYSWIVDGQPLRSRSNSSWRANGNRMTGNAVPPWNVSCLARNLVSQVQTPQQAIHCQDLEVTLPAAEHYVKVALFVMYNALLIRGILGMRTTANQ